MTRSNFARNQFQNLWFRYKDKFDKLYNKNAKKQPSDATTTTAGTTTTANSNGNMGRYDHRGRGGVGNGGRTLQRRHRVYNNNCQHLQHPPPYYQQQVHQKTTGPLDVARFGLLSIATLPFSLWIALYSYDYYYRIDHCREALAQGDPDWDAIAANHKDTVSPCPLIGRESQLGEIQALLSSNSPRQIIVVAGPNESGKSRFVSEIIKTIDPSEQGVTYIQLAQIVDSLSTLTYAFVRSFNLRWLQMRYALVDVLPFAGSEILVMKERFSSRDLVQALMVITEALKQHAIVESAQKNNNCKNRRLPVIIVDGLGEGSGWIRRTADGKNCLQRLLKWCIYVTKERGLCHVILTGNEELVISLTDSNRLTRGHVKVIGLGDLDVADTASTSAGNNNNNNNNNPGQQKQQARNNLRDSPPGRIIIQEFPDATNAEIQKITDTFGGFVHDLSSTGRQIQYVLSQQPTKPTRKERSKIIDLVLSERFRLQVERVTAAFAKGIDDDSLAEMRQRNNSSNNACADDDDDDLDPYLDPLKEIYSEAQASQNDTVDDDPEHELSNTTSWSQLQLWRTLQMLVDSKDMTVPFADLRDDVFGGDMTPILELMNEDVLGFEVVDNSSSSSMTSDSSSSSKIINGSSLYAGWSWQVKPATPALRRVFRYLVQDSSLKERFLVIQEGTDRQEKLDENERDRFELRRERRRLDLRKNSLLKTMELGKVLRMEDLVRKKIGGVYKKILSEELDIEKRCLEVLKKRESLRHEQQQASSSSTATTPDHHCKTNTIGDVNNNNNNEPDHASIQRQVLTAIKNSQNEEREKKKFRHRFENLAKSKAGITASDLVALIKKSTGEELDIEEANSFIRTWDANDDAHLDYDEFVDMLLTDHIRKLPSKRSDSKYV